MSSWSLLKQQQWVEVFVHWVWRKTLSLCRGPALLTNRHPAQHEGAGDFQTPWVTMINCSLRRADGFIAGLTSPVAEQQHSFIVPRSQLPIQSMGPHGQNHRHQAPLSPVKGFSCPPSSGTAQQIVPELCLPHPSVPYRPHLTTCGGNTVILKAQPMNSSRWRQSKGASYPDAHYGNFKVCFPSKLCFQYHLPWHALVVCTPQVGHLMPLWGRLTANYMVGHSSSTAGYGLQQLSAPRWPISSSSARVSGTVSSTRVAQLLSPTSQNLCLISLTFTRLFVWRLLLLAMQALVAQVTSPEHLRACSGLCY